jgi:hypothetical protein
MPRELEPLYEYIFGLIEPIYLPWASKAFQIVRLTRDLATFPNNRVDALSILTFSLAINEKFNPENSLDLSSESIDVTCEDTEVQLMARCAGFLEVKRFKEFGRHAHIGYLHGTVRNFLESEVLWPRLLVHTSRTVFDPYVSMMRACVLQVPIQYNLEPKNERLQIFDIASDVLAYARGADQNHETRETQIQILDTLDRLMTKYSDKTGHWSLMYGHLRKHNDPANTDSEGDSDESNIEQNKNEIASFLRVAQIYQLTGYVNKKAQGLIGASKRKRGAGDRKGKRRRVRGMPRTP